MKPAYQEYEVRRIVNVHKHVDGPWFWGKYTAHPYVGCSSGCEFCYERGGRYIGRRDPDSFDSLIQVKTNAVTLLRKEMGKLTPEIISVGDWQQPAEKDYCLSRGMLEVVLEYGFPLFIIERSPLLTRDLDLLSEINRKTWVGVLYSISNLGPALKQAFEPCSPGVRQRLQAIRRLSEAGIYAGVSMMPVIPFTGDDESHLEDLIMAVRDHGGRCVLSGGLTMNGIQAERTLAAAIRHDPALEEKWRKFYRWPPEGQPTYGPPRDYNARLGLKVRDLCSKHGISDRMPRYVLPGTNAVNKHIAARLFMKTYDLELEMAVDQRIWAYRKAAWTIDEMPENIATIYTALGTRGLTALPAIGERLAGQIAAWLEAGDLTA